MEGVADQGAAGDVGGRPHDGLDPSLHQVGTFGLAGGLASLLDAVFCLRFGALMELLRKQKNTSFLKAVEGQQGQFFKTFPAGFFGFSFNSLACGFGEHPGY